MVRISKSKVSPRQIESKKLSETQLNSVDQSSSKILHVVRQALLNAAAELVFQRKNSSENQLTLDLNKNEMNQSQQRNENAKKKKTIVRKKNRRK